MTITSDIPAWRSSPDARPWLAAGDVELGTGGGGWRLSCTAVTGSVCDTPAVIAVRSAGSEWLGHAVCADHLADARTMFTRPSQETP